MARFHFEFGNKSWTYAFAGADIPFQINHQANQYPRNLLAPVSPLINDSHGKKCSA